MKRFFNTAGPVDPDRHYCLPPLTRFDLEEVLLLIEQQKYFVLHAPRQTGKTSSLLALREHLNRQGRFRCIYTNVEMAQAARENVGDGVRAILSVLADDALDAVDDRFLRENWRSIFEESGAFSALQRALRKLCKQSPSPVVLLMDEIDSLVGDTLISVLRQLRAGYPNRPDGFPISVILCGVRDVRDYRIHSAREKEVITGGSAFNIKAESLRLGDLSEEEVHALLDQHVAETGQPFEAGARDRIWAYTQGQPWLVNALAYEACFKMKGGRDRARPITGGMILQARENLILRRETHLDQLADKLREPRVRAIIEPLLTGVKGPKHPGDDDLQYVVDLGLVRRKPQVAVSNPIYKEIIPRMLTETTQDTFSVETSWFVTPDGRLDMGKLLREFQQFFREHSEHWAERFQYKEAGPQLLLQAFLQRIVNADGRVEREYGLGRGRTDLLVVWPHGQGVQKTVIELKIRYGGLESTIKEGLDQTEAYMDRCGAEEGHLVIFDRSGERSWEEKIFRREEEVERKRIFVWGM